jgi:uncharacterized protein (DUF1499 family)
MQRARYVLVGASLVAALLFLASGPGTRAGLWEWQSGFGLMRWAMWVGFATAALALVMLIIPKTRGPQPTILVAALLMGIVAGAPAVSLRTQADSLPRIHDITTDVRDPPAFVALLEARKASPNGSDYGGPEIAAQQAKAYPNVRPMLLPLSQQEAFARAADVARAMGWEIVSADAATGRIEATATTLWFGFKDDIIVRIAPHGTSSRVDVRSVSRVGKSDIGANARRIQEYLSKLT